MHRRRVGVVRGFSSQLEIWRLLTATGLWDLPHYAVKDDAVYQRLKDAGRDTFQTLFGQVTAVLQRQLRPVSNNLGGLAAFASGVYALDGMTLSRAAFRVVAERLAAQRRAQRSGASPLKPRVRRAMAR